MRTRKRPRQPVLPQIRVPAATAAERRMLKEYRDLINGKASRAKLASWAKRNKVRLKGKRVGFERHHVAPGTAAADDSCSQICRVVNYGGSAWGGKVNYECTLTGCDWSHEKRRWECYYSCWITTLAPD